METTRYLLAAATARPITDEEWTEEEVAPPEFALPWWMDDDLVRDLALIGRPFPADSDLREDLPVADSLDWIASKGYSLLATLNQQIGIRHGTALSRPAQVSCQPPKSRTAGDPHDWIRSSLRPRVNCGGRPLTSHQLPGFQMTSLGI